MLTARRFGVVGSVVTASLAVAAAGCSSGSVQRAADPTTRAPVVAAAASTPTVPAPTTITSPPSTTAPPTTPKPPVTAPRPTIPATTIPASPFPALIVAAVDSFVPRPPGLQAPVTLPPAPASITAQASGLGGTDSVTLIATPRSVPVNDPSLSATAPGVEDLGTFSTTAASSTTTARSYLSSNTAASLPSCATPGHPTPLGPVGATACTTLTGGLIAWSTGPWTIAVQELGSSTSPTSVARSVASTMASPGLPDADRGVVSVVVPATTADGSGTTASLSWQRGTDVYQVRGSRGWSATLSLADSLRPYPAG